MIVRRPITRFRSNTLRAAVMCLVAAYPAVAKNPPAKPLIISIAPIGPKGNGEHLPRLDNGVDDLKTALYNAWQRRTDQELDIKIPDEEVSLAVKETSKMATPALAVAASYIVRTTYLKVGNRTKATAAIWRPATYTAVTAVSDEPIDPDGPNPFTKLGEKLADALANLEHITVTTYQLAFCRFGFNGPSQPSEGMLENLRVNLQYLVKASSPMPILAAEPSDCAQQTSRSLAPAAGAKLGGSGVSAAAGGTETIYVSGIVYFFPNKIVINLVVRGEVVGEQKCAREQDLSLEETVNSLISDFWSRLDDQIRRHRRGR